MSSGGWDAVVDPGSGKTYYFNASTNETSWDVPEGDDTRTVNVDFGDGDARSRPEARRRPSGGRDRSPSVGAASGSISRGSLRRGKSRERAGDAPAKKGFLAGPTASFAFTKGKSSAGDAGRGGMAGFGSDGALAEEGEEGNKGPDDADPSFEAKIQRFTMFEAKVGELAKQVDFHAACFGAAFDGDGAFASEAVKLAGQADPDLRKQAVLAWAGSSAAGAVAASYTKDIYALSSSLAGAAEFFKTVHVAIKERATVEKEFAHYIGKLAELRMQAAKAKGGGDAKKLARNQQKYDETMIRLEMETTRVVELFTEAERRREALVLKDFVAWQRSQHHHLPQLLGCFEVCVCGGSGGR